MNFALEVHPTEIAFDIASAQRALEAVKNHKRFGFNYDPSHLGYQGVDYVKFIRTFKDRIFHVHMKDAWWGHGDGTVGVFGGHVSFADPRRFWDFRSLGHGDVNFEEIIVALNDIGYQGPLSRRVGRLPHGPRARRQGSLRLRPQGGLQALGHRLRRPVRPMSIHAETQSSQRLDSVERGRRSLPRLAEGGRMMSVKRRLFTILAAFSLVLCLATTGLWVRSYWPGISGYLPLRLAAECDSGSMFLFIGPIAISDRPSSFSGLRVMAGTEGKLPRDSPVVSVHPHRHPPGNLALALPA